MNKFGFTVWLVLAVLFPLHSYAQRSHFKVLEANGEITNYDFKSELGSGGAGKVFLVQDQVSGKEVSLKVFTDTTFEVGYAYVAANGLSKPGSESYLIEFEIVQLIGHDGRTRPAIRMPIYEKENPEVSDLTLLKTFKKGGRGELAAKVDDLFNKWQSNFRGIMELHAKGLSHNDIKANNSFWVAERNRYLVGDYDFVTPTKEVQAAGAIYYFPPDAREKAPLPGLDRNLFALAQMMIGLLGNAHLDAYQNLRTLFTLQRWEFETLRAEFEQLQLSMIAKWPAGARSSRLKFYSLAKFVEAYYRFTSEERAQALLELAQDKTTEPSMRRDLETLFGLNVRSSYPWWTPGGFFERAVEFGRLCRAAFTP